MNMKRDLISRRLEKEIEIIEEDDSLTVREKADAIHELEKEAREYFREQDDDESNT